MRAYVNFLRIPSNVYRPSIFVRFIWAPVRRGLSSGLSVCLSVDGLSEFLCWPRPNSILRYTSVVSHLRPVRVVDTELHRSAHSSDSIRRSDFDFIFIGKTFSAVRKLTNYFRRILTRSIDRSSILRSRLFSSGCWVSCSRCLCFHTRKKRNLGLWILIKMDGVQLYTSSDAISIVSTVKPFSGSNESKRKVNCVSCLFNLFII